MPLLALGVAVGRAARARVGLGVGQVRAGVRVWQDQRQPAQEREVQPHQGRHPPHLCNERRFQLHRECSVLFLCSSFQLLAQPLGLDAFLFIYFYLLELILLYSTVGVGMGQGVIRLLQFSGILSGEMKTVCLFISFPENMG